MTNCTSKLGKSNLISCELNLVLEISKLTRKESMLEKKVCCGFKYYQQNSWYGFKYYQQNKIQVISYFSIYNLIILIGKENVLGEYFEECKQMC